jgi:hypothetical protein
MLVPSTMAVFRWVHRKAEDCLDAQHRGWFSNAGKGLRSKPDKRRHAVEHLPHALWTKS